MQIHVLELRFAIRESFPALIMEFILRRMAGLGYRAELVSPGN